MDSAESAEWQAVTPLVYSYLAAFPLSAHHHLTDVRIVGSSQPRSWKYEEFKVLAAGTNHQGGGLLSVSEVRLPQENQLDDTRLRALVPQTHQLRLESEVTCLEECFMGSKQSQRFVAIAEKNYASLLLYELEAIENLQHGSTINPRLTLTGHSTPLTVIRSQGASVLSGSKKGDICLHDVNKGSQSQAVCFSYHRQPVTGLIWLQGVDRSFASGCEDGSICIWDTRSSQPSFKIDSKHGQVTSLESAKQNCLLSGGSDCAVRFWDIKSTNRNCGFYPFKLHSQPITRLLSLGSERKAPGFFLSGASNGEVIVWQEEAEFVHLMHKQSIVGISRAGGGSTACPILTADRSSQVSLWKPAIFNQYQPS